MVHSLVVEKQLRAIGADQLFWGKFELAELPKILINGEIIEHVQHGHYSGGFATLVATNHRLLLVDKKPFFLTVIDLRYDMIAEVDFGQQFIGATLHIQSFNKELKFKTFNRRNLRTVANFIQHKVMEMRGQQTESQAQNQSNQESGSRQSIPMQVFTSTNNELTEAQTNGLLPLDKESWYRLNPNRRIVNPYTQTPLLTRRRIGRFNFASRDS